MLYLLQSCKERIIGLRNIWVTEAYSHFRPWIIKKKAQTHLISGSKTALHRVKSAHYQVVSQHTACICRRQTYKQSCIEVYSLIYTFQLKSISLQVNNSSTKAINSFGALTNLHTIQPNTQLYCKFAYINMQ